MLTRSTKALSLVASTSMPCHPEKKKRRENKMRPSPKYTTSKISLAFLKLAAVVLLSCITMHSSDSDVPSLRRLGVSGHFRFDDGILHAAKDFGNRCQFMPSAVLYPKSASDISATVRHVYQMGPRSRLTVAARGHGHSLQGQAQASGGIVVMMESLREAETRVVVRAGDDNAPYVEASGGALWINVLRDSLRHDLAPKSWTDYLRLTVGGTLSNAGVSGQAFRHGPQISNVQQLEIITGTGEMMNCSAEENTDLFFAVLGGLGQFGIITRARIALEPAPKMVRWVRVLYSDFSIFFEDQEMLIEAEDTFDYIEGFVIKNRTGLVDNWRSFLYPKDPIQASQFESEGRTLFCLEMTKNYFNHGRTNNLLEQEINKLLSRLRYVPSTLFQSDVPYVDFLDRVHASELKLKTKGMWDVPHPWLNLMVPGKRIKHFAAEVFGSIVTDSSNGPIIVYPVNKSKWDNRTSAVFPDEEIFYMVAFLSSATSSSDQESLARLLKQNENILDFCRKSRIAVKQYLPQHTSMDEWKSHFGHRRWGQFLRRKSLYDPLAILAPGQRIFRKDNIPVSRHLHI